MTDARSPDAEPQMPQASAASPPPPSRRPSGWMFAMGAGAAVLLVVIILVIVAVRPAGTAAPPTSPTPVVAATTTATPSVLPTPPAAKSGSGSIEEQQQKLYRAYMSTILIDGASLAGQTAGIAKCRRGRAACESAMQSAQAATATFQSDLNKTPPPGCLTDADSRLKTGLGLYQRGLRISQEAVRKEDRVHLVQGLLLDIAGAGAIGQALHSGRQAQC